MSTISLLQSGLAGFQKATTDAQRSAASIASSASLSEPSTGTDLTEALVTLKQAEIQAQASAKVIAAADETMGRLLDELA